MTKENIESLKMQRLKEESTFTGVPPRVNTRLWMGMLVLSSDTMSFLMAAILSIAIRVLLGDPWRFDLFLQTIPVLVISAIFFALNGLYPGIGMSAVEEFRKLVTTATIVVIALAALSFWARNANEYSRLTLTLTWFFSLIILPLNRTIVRTLGVRLKIWGEPVAIIGYGKQGKWALDFFRKNTELGLRPIVIMDLNESGGYDEPDILVLKVNDILLGRTFEQITGVGTAVVILSDVPPEFLNYIISSKQGGFDRLILIPSLEQISSYGVMSFDFGGVLGLEVRHNLLDIRQQALKRTMDVLLVLLGGLIISPLLIFLTALVMIDSKGSPFYGQIRIGKGGKKFKALKFRSMVRDADVILKDYLETHPELQEEWKATFKLKNDPRITRLGRFIRKFSLDEFPQLINVLKGEMSLVGPRPIVDDEVHHYGDLFNPYTWVRPGMTGMWQVSGRSDTAYTERVHLDEYYVRNWSIWLDIYILIKTIFVVLRKKGAY